MPAATAGSRTRRTGLLVTDTSAKALPQAPHPDNPIWTIENLAFVFHLVGQRPRVHLPHRLPRRGQDGGAAGPGTATTSWAGTASSPSTSLPPAAGATRRLRPRPARSPSPTSRVGGRRDRPGARSRPARRRHRPRQRSGPQERPALLQADLDQPRWNRRPHLRRHHLGRRQCQGHRPGRAAAAGSRQPFSIAASHVCLPESEAPGATVPTRAHPLAGERVATAEPDPPPSAAQELKNSSTLS